MKNTLAFATLDRPRVLIVALAGIGNLLMASPLFRSLKDANAEAEIDVLVAPRGTADVLEGNPRIRKILRASASPNLADARAVTKLLRRERYNLGLVAHPGQLMWSAFLLRCGGVRRRVGHWYTWKMFRHTGLFLTDAVDVLPHAPLALTERSAHDVVQNLNLLKPLGIEVPAPRSPALLEGLGEVGYDFPLSPDDRARADAWLTQQRLTGNVAIGFHPGAFHDLSYKRWPTERWAALGDRLAERYRATILVFGGRDERDRKTEVCARMKHPAIPVELPLRHTAAVMARCMLFISNDSGLMHVAVSQNVPTFGLFGPTDERRTAPWGPLAFAIRAPGTLPSYDVGDLARIRAERAPHPSLLSLTVDEVMRHIEETAGAAVRSSDEVSKR